MSVQITFSRTGPDTEEKQIIFSPEPSLPSVDNSISVTGDPYAGDKIYQSLTTANQTTYRDAATNSLIEISQTEYETLQTKVASTVIGGSTTTRFNSATNSTLVNQDCIIANTTTVIPANTYIYALAIHVVHGPSPLNNNLYFYANTTSTIPASGFVQLGSSQLSLTGSGWTKHYFVLKGKSSINSSTSSYLAISGSGINTAYLGYTTSGSIVIRQGAGTLPITTSTTTNQVFSTYTIGIQCLTSTSIQWVI